MKKIIFIGLLVIVFALSTTVLNAAKLKVGYSDFTSIGSCPKFTAVADRGYNIIVLAFAKLENSTVTLPYKGPFQTMSALLSDMAAAKAAHAGLKVYISFGGQGDYNTWHPNSASAAAVAASIVECANTYGFDGVDLDLEIQVNATFINDVIAGIKTGNPSLDISIAPQGVPDYTKVISGQNYSAAGFVTTGWCYGYNEAIESGNIDYIFVQLYNNCWWQLNGISETSPAFIPAFVNSTKNVNVPPSCKIIPGLPATKAAGNGVTGNAPDADIKAALTPFNGTMTWSTNHDSLNGWNFVTNVMPD